MGEAETEWFVAMIEAMDNAYIAHRNEKPASNEDAMVVRLDDTAGIKRLLVGKSRAPE